MTVLITVPRLDLPGGVANLYRVLSPHLASFATYFEIGTKKNESGIFAAARRAILDYWHFHRALSEQHYSLVHLNPSFVYRSLIRDAIFLLVARAHSVPVLVFFHGWNDELRRFVARRLRGLFRRILNESAAVIVLAEDFRAQLNAMGIRPPIFRLTTCVADVVFETGARRPRKKTNSFNVLYLSRLDHGKGAVEAIQAFAALATAVPEATLTIAGDGPERTNAERTAIDKMLKNVEFLGHVDGHAKDTAFMDADVYLFPTLLDEGMPTTVLEAMAFGLPVVTRSVGGLRDFFVQPDMGFITESRQYTAFVPMLLQLASDGQLRDAIADFNRSYAKDHFSASSLASRLREIYDRIKQSAQPNNRYLSAN